MTIAVDMGRKATKTNKTMTNGDPEGRIFLSYPYTHDGFLRWHKECLLIRKSVSESRQQHGFGVDVRCRPGTEVSTNAPGNWNNHWT